MTSTDYDSTYFGGPINVPSEEGFGEIQSLVDSLFASGATVDSLQLVSLAEINDVHPDSMEVVNLLPSGTYTRPQLCDRLNSIITAHGWGSRYGTVE